VVFNTRVAAVGGTRISMALTVFGVDPATASSVTSRRYRYFGVFSGLGRITPARPFPALRAKGAWQPTRGPGRIRREIEAMTRFQSTSLEEIAWT